MADSEWKRHFLSSGVPLEYEVAQALAAQGMAVSPDYSYLRSDGDQKKQFSVDISARMYSEARSSIKYALDILIECKYRSRDKYILFFLDPNKGDFERSHLGRTIFTVDQFNKEHLSPNSLFNFEADFPVVYKGVEVFDKGAYEKDLRHGSQQLRYAAPIQLKEAMHEALYGHEDDSFPTFLTRILVTNAPLRIIRSGIGISQIEAVKDVDEISDEVDAAILLSDSSPDFEKHWSETFEKSDQASQRDIASRLTYRLDHSGKKYPFRWDQPDNFVDSVFKMQYPANAIGKQHFVVTLKGLPALFKGIKGACDESHRKRRKSGKFT